MNKFLPLIVIAFLSMGVDECGRPTSHYDCARGYNYYHKLAPGEDFQCQKEYKQEQVWKDVGIGLTRAPSDMVECICIPTIY